MGTPQDIVAVRDPARSLDSLLIATKQSDGSLVVARLEAPFSTVASRTPVASGAVRIY